MTREESVAIAQEKFAALIKEDFKRIDRMNQAQEPLDFNKLDTIVVGILPGDGIGPVIMPLALRVMEALVGEDIDSGKIQLRHIEGMTIENRVAKLESLPDECMEQIKQCHVLLKGPMVTPRAGDGLPNLVSANSLLRRGLDLYAAVRPIDIPDRNIHWTFFRENIEGEYIWGNKGIQVDEDLAVDFKVQTRMGSRRIARAAFEFARKNGKHNVTIVTKANIVKLADGNFIKAVREVGKDYPDIEIQERLVDAWWETQFREKPPTGQVMGYVDVVWQMIQKDLGYTLCFLPEEYTNPYGLCLYPLQNPVGTPVTRNTWFLYPQNKRLNENVERFVDFILRDRKRASIEQQN